MNDEFSPIKSDGEDAPAPVRKPLRHARRTVAPFSRLNERESTEEVKDAEPIAEDLPAPAAQDKEIDSFQITEDFTPPSVADENAFISEDAPEKTEDLNLPSETEGETASDEQSSDESEETPGEDTENQVSDEDRNEAADCRENAEESHEKKQEDTLSPAANAFDWVKSFLFSLTVVIFVFTLLFRGVTVNGDSMLPTLNDSEYLIISDLFYTPKTGDIVVVQSPHYKNATEPLIKRIIATGGQKVKINFETWEVWVDGKLLHEDYILRDANTSMHTEDLTPDENHEVEFTVEDQCIFVMGDHRNDSLDSRSNSVGQIDERYIMGRVLLRLTPFDRFGKVE